jgi:hypothetical protein
MGTQSDIDGYSVFISFSADDDAGWRSAFKEHVGRHLRGLGRIFYSETDPILSGGLRDELARALAASRVLVSIIGPHYLTSNLCPFELQAFFDSKPREVQRTRFLAVCLDRTVSEQLVEWPAWTSAGLTKDQVRHPFFSQDGSRIPAYLVGPSYQAIPNQAFNEEVERLCKHIQAMIEKAQGEDGEPKTRTAIIGAVNPALEPFAAQLEAELAKELPPPDWAIDRLTLADIEKDDRDDSNVAKRLAQASVLVLPISDETPELSVLGAGGHVGYQKECWDRSKAEGQYVVFWSTDIDVPEERRAKGRHREFLASLQAIDGADADVCKAVRQLFYPEETPPEDRSPQAKIVIESNERDPSTGPLKERIEKLWEMLQREDPALRGVSLITHPLSYRLIRSLNRKLSADAVILVWDSKPADAVYAQVDNVDREFAPPRKFIAYLSPPNPADATEDFLGWEVMPFQVKEEEDASRTRVKVVEEFETARDRVKGFLVDLANAKLGAAKPGPGVKLQ